MKINSILKHVLLILGIVLLVFLILYYIKPLLNIKNQPTVDKPLLQNTKNEASADNKLPLRGYDELQVLFPDKTFSLTKKSSDYVLAEISKESFWCPDYYSFFKANELGEIFYPDILSADKDDVSCFLPVNGNVFRYHRNRTKTLTSNDGSPIIENWNGAYEFTWLLDAEGRCIYENESSYYYYDKSTKSFIETSVPHGDFTFLEYSKGLYSPIMLGYNSDNTTFERFSENNLIGYRNGNETLIPAEYIMSFGFSENTVALYNGETVHVYNENGERLFEEYTLSLPPYTNTNLLGFYRCENNLMRIYVKGEGGLEYEKTVFINGNIFLSPDTYSIMSYTNGVFLLKDEENKYSFYTSKGHFLNDEVYDNARPFSEGLAVVEKNGKKGVIDLKGEYVISPEWDEICDCSGGVLTLFKNDTKWHIVNKLEEN